MSFTKNIKSELAKSKLSKDKEVIRYELLGYVISNITFISSDMIQFTNENLDILERYKYIIKRICNLDLEITQSDNELFVNKTLFEMSIYNNEISILSKILSVKIISAKEIELIKNELDMEKQENIIPFIRGIFLGSGYLSNPQGNYHLEIYIDGIDKYNMLVNILKKYSIHTNLSNKKNKNVIYITDGESISNFLALIGANIGVINFEQTRVIKSINNNMNRVINCETANLNKTMEASKQLIEEIDYLKKIGKYEMLSEVLKSTCEIRIKNSDFSLTEIADVIGISKSGLNNRFKKIHDIVKEIKKKEGNNEKV